MTDDELLARINERAHDPRRATDEGGGIVHPDGVGLHANDVATAAEVADAERALGFPLPPLLRRLYLEVGDGAFGPGYGLNHLGGVVEQYLGMRAARDEPWLREWYEGMLPVCEWGCGIASLLDCTRPEAPVIRCDPNGMDPAGLPPTSHHLGGPYWMESPSLRRWLEDWLEGRPLFYLPYGSSGPDDPELMK